MTQSVTYTHSITFTVTHARHLATKVSTDLKRIQRFYGSPSDSQIDAYEGELVELLRGGYLATVRYGFKRGDAWVEPMIEYTSHELASASDTDDDPGRIRPGADISGARFYSYLTKNANWSRLSDAERAAIERSLPVERGYAPEPGVNGYLVADRMYTAGGRTLSRSSLRSLP